VVGLDYYNARWYDPELGRFIQADTVIANANDPTSYDRYAYVDNNPVNHNDPTGHFCDEFGNCYSGATGQKYTPTLHINWSFYDVSAPPKPPSLESLPKITAHNTRSTAPTFSFLGIEVGAVQTSKVIIGDNSNVLFPPEGIGTSRKIGDVQNSLTYYFNDNSTEIKTDTLDSAGIPNTTTYETLKPNNIVDFQIGIDVMAPLSVEVSNGVKYQVSTGEYVSYSPVQLALTAYTLAVGAYGIGALAELYRTIVSSGGMVPNTGY
jgi:RHS repeat-associated protein